MAVIQPFYNRWQRLCYPFKIAFKILVIGQALFFVPALDKRID